MTFASAALLAFVVSTCQAAHTVQQFAIEASVPVATTIPQAEYCAPLTGKVAARARRQAYKKELVQHLSGTKYVGQLAGAGMDAEYTTPVTIGGQKFTVILDTGSSDPWIPAKGFKCTNETNFPEPESVCNFGPAKYDLSKSKTFKSYPGHNLNIAYGDGEYVSGPVGFDTMTIAGLTVENQEFGIANAAAWSGDGVTSGLVGFAYPELTSVYNTSNPAKDTAANAAPYNPFFFTAVQEKKVKPFFSISLDRGSFAAQENATVDPHLGYIAFGGLPPVKVTKTSSTVKVKHYTVSNSKKAEYLYWTVPVDKYVFPGSTKLATNGTAILDTGTTLNYLPTPVAAAVNKQFKPPAKFSEDYGLYIVNCKATAPAFSVVLGGVAFAVDGKDQILPAGTDEHGRELCISGTQDGGADTPNNIFILGDVFLHNVVSTFQTAANAVTLTERTKY